MGYDEATDIYTCHAGKKLQPLFIKKQKSKSGYESEVTVYECEDCTGCPYKEKCTKAKRNKVKLEILLLCMGYNLNKLHSKIQKERTGTHLFEIKETA